jgi:hypothetical protein
MSFSKSKPTNRSLPIEIEREYSGSDDQKDGDEMLPQESFEFERSDTMLTGIGKVCSYLNKLCLFHIYVLISPQYLSVCFVELGGR